MAQVTGIAAVAPDAIERLLDRAFGTDRHGRTAYRLRAGTHAIPELSFALVGDGALLGSIQCWPVRFAGDDGTVRPLVLVGPVAVVPERQQEGFGRTLMEASLAVADARRLDLLLIGDPEYYGRFFGFTAAATAGWRLPGPVERHRLLARGPQLPCGSGTVGPQTPVGAPGLYPAGARPDLARMPMAPLPDFDMLTVADIARLADSDRLPPVERWHPAHCGDSEMRIARDGTWFHQEAPIARPAMVRAFSRILRREPDGGHVLVTPVEKLSIAVEDAPFVAVEMKAAGAGRDATLAFRLNTGELVTASATHPLRIVERADGPHPYVRVRGGLEALVVRAVYYELVERALADGGDPPGVWSAGAFFAMVP